MASDPKKSKAAAEEAQDTMRSNIFMELLNTEVNYVKVFETIEGIFQKPLEALASKSSRAVLSKYQIEAIFGKLPQIHKVHQHMLEGLRQVEMQWSEHCSIGKVILQHREQLLKAYPPYVNSFEETLNTLQRCEEGNSRFQSFLSKNQAQAECRRETLKDLMIRPIQRLPSMGLILKALLKNTPDSHNDFEPLQKAVKAIEEVLGSINEEKRKSDEFKLIDGCPTQLLSLNICFVTKCQVVEISRHLGTTGDELTLLLFSHSLIVCKKRSRRLSLSHSPYETRTHTYVASFLLYSVRFVINISDDPRGFALLYRDGDRSKLFAFCLLNGTVDKTSYLGQICQQILKYDPSLVLSKILIHRPSQELGVRVNLSNISHLHKAIQFAVRAGEKVKRRLSISKQWPMTLLENPLAIGGLDYSLSDSQSTRMSFNGSAFIPEESK